MALKVGEEPIEIPNGLWDIDAVQQKLGTGTYASQIVLLTFVDSDRFSDGAWIANLKSIQSTVNIICVVFKIGGAVVTVTRPAGTTFPIIPNGGWTSSYAQSYFAAFLLANDPAFHNSPSQWMFSFLLEKDAAATTKHRITDKWHADGTTMNDPCSLNRLVSPLFESTLYPTAGTYPATITFGSNIRGSDSTSIICSISITYAAGKYSYSVSCTDPRISYVWPTNGTVLPYLSRIKFAFTEDVTGADQLANYFITSGSMSMTVEYYGRKKFASWDFKGTEWYITSRVANLDSPVSIQYALPPTSGAYNNIDTVDLVFSRPVNAINTSLTANYRLSGAGWGSRGIQSIKYAYSESIDGSYIGQVENVARVMLDSNALANGNADLIVNDNAVIANRIKDSGNNELALTTKSYLVITSAPVISAVSPASGDRINAPKVSYSLSGTLQNGTITWTRTGGAADPNSPHVVPMPSTELAPGAHNNLSLAISPALVDGAIYRVDFDGVDLAGNAAATLSSTSLIYDATAPSISGVSPVAGDHINAPKVSYSLSEALLSGTITWIRTGGTTDANSPHVVAMPSLTAGAHNNLALAISPALVDGAIYRVDFNGVDLTGNPATTMSSTAVTYDTTAPAISGVFPANGDHVNAPKASYALSEALQSGTIAWTRIGGTADSNSPHSVAMPSTELASGTHNNIALAISPALVDGAIYRVDFDGVDLAGNAATRASSTNVTFDTTAPVISAVSPATEDRINSTKTSYTLSEALQSGTVSWTRTGGIADANSPHVIAMPTTELAAGAHNNVALAISPALVDGTVYRVDFDGVDLAGNAASTASSTNVTYDATMRVISGISPAAGDHINAPKVSYSLLKALQSGSITWIRTGGSADINSPHTAALPSTELAAGTHSNIALTLAIGLVDGAVYQFAFDGVDSSGNTLPQQLIDNVTFDSTVPAISGVSPATGDRINSTKASYSLSEALQSGTIAWTRTGGTADPNSPHVAAIPSTELAAGAHNNIMLSISPTLVDGAVYQVDFNGVDLAGNAALTVSSTNITYDAIAPAISVLSPVAGDHINSTKVSYSLSKALQSGTITWTRTGGTADANSPHAAAMPLTELASGAHNNIPLAIDPALVDGAIYQVAFDGVDSSGNALPRPVIDNVTYDATPPRILSATWNIG